MNGAVIDFDLRAQKKRLVAYETQVICTWECSLLTDGFVLANNNDLAFLGLTIRA